MRISALAVGFIMIAVMGCGVSESNEAREDAVPMYAASENMAGRDLAPLLRRIGDLNEKSDITQKKAARLYLDKKLASAQLEATKTKTYLSTNKVLIERIDRADLRRVMFKGWRNAVRNIDGMEMMIQATSEGNRAKFEAGVSEITKADRDRKALARSDPFRNVEMSATEQAALAGE